MGELAWFQLSQEPSVVSSDSRLVMQQRSAHPEGGPSDSRLMESLMDISRVGPDSRLVHTQVHGMIWTIGLPRGKGGMRDRAAGETVAGTGERVHRAVGKTVLSRPVLSQLVFCFSFPGVVCRCAVPRIGFHRFPTAAQPLVCGWAQV